MRHFKRITNKTKYCRKSNAEIRRMIGERRTNTGENNKETIESKVLNNRKTCGRKYNEDTG